MFNPEQKDKQVEFFDDLSGAAKKSKKAKLHLARIAVSLSYENIIILSIGLIMLLIVCYSLGIEKGQRLVQISSTGENAETTGNTESATKIEQEQLQQKPKTLPVKKSPRLGPYIQVASFRTKKYAEKEMQRLKNSGHQPFLATWGRFKVVCVGGYKDKAEAVDALKQLRKVYADCILRQK